MVGVKQCAWWCGRDTRIMVVLDQPQLDAKDPQRVVKLPTCEEHRGEVIEAFSDVFVGCVPVVEERSEPRSVLIR